MKEKLYTERLILRPWASSDAESLFACAKDPRVGPIAGWPVHESVEYSKTAIRDYLSLPGTYAICLKEDNIAVGSVGLLFGENSNLAVGEKEAELGYWIGVPFWGRGLIPEACRELLRCGFEELGLEKIWCAYFNDNVKSRRVQEKLGFTYSHTNQDVYWELLDDRRTEHIYSMTKAQWAEMRRRKEENMSKISVEIVEKPARKAVVKRGGKAADYFAYCAEVGCDVWDELLAMAFRQGEPVSMWLSARDQKPGTSVYVQGVETAPDFDGPVPDGFDILDLPAATYLMFRSEPFADEDFCQAIGAVQAFMNAYDPSVLGCRWDDEEPRIQLEPWGARGYMEFRAVRKCEQQV